MNRVKDWTACKRAVAKGYGLVFNFYSGSWKGFTANLIETNNTIDRVYGAVYHISKEKLDKLTRQYEGVEPKVIPIEAEGDPKEAKAYIFTTSRESGKPPDDYLETILVGLRQHGYSKEVIEKVKKIAESH